MDEEYDSEDVDIYYSYDNLYEFVIFGVLLNAFVIFGIFGNVTSMIILSRPQMRNSINFLLIALACSDTLYIIIMFLYFGLPSIFVYKEYLSYNYYFIYQHIESYINPIMFIAQTMTVFLTVMVSLERYIVVCHPLRAISLCTRRRAKMCIAAILAFSLVCNLPRFWEEAHIPTNSTIDHTMEDITLYDHPIYNFVYEWLFYVFIYFVPFALLFILNSLIYREVRRANAQRQHLSPLRCHEVRIAKMLLCVVIVFFVCYVFSITALLVIDRTSVLLFSVSELLVTINSSVNFIIYVIFFKKFRQLFLEMFCLHSLCNRESSNEVTGTSELNEAPREIWRPRVSF